MENFKTSFVVEQNPQAVFEAFNRVSDWWGPVEGASQQIGDEFIYRHGEIHYSKHRVIEMVPGKKVVWLTVESQLNFGEQKNEWDGTQIVFDINEQNGLTTLKFTQEGLTAALECYGGCSGAWAYYIGESLRDLITTGKGNPDR